MLIYSRYYFKPYLSKLCHHLRLPGEFIPVWLLRWLISYFDISLWLSLQNMKNKKKLMHNHLDHGLKVNSFFWFFPLYIVPTFLDLQTKRLFSEQWVVFLQVFYFTLFLFRPFLRLFYYDVSFPFMFNV